MNRSMRVRQWLMLLLLGTPLIVGFLWPGTVEWLCTRGVRQYRNMDFNRAKRSFERALERDPDNPTIMHNRAMALHQEGRLEEAAEGFRAAAKAADDDLAADAWYGLGNTLFRAGEFAGAIDAYREALRIDPSDPEAKFNLEIAWQQMREQQQPDVDDDADDGEAEDDETTPPEPDETASDDPEDPEERREESPEPHEETPEAEEPSEPEVVDEEEFTAEDARRLLRALTAEDAEIQRTVRPQQERRLPREGEKDW